MRRWYIVSYDIRDPKRLNRVFRVLKGYGEHWQYSVFFCALRDTARVRLQADLEKEMNLKEDQAIIVDLGTRADKALESISVVGAPLPPPDDRMLVI
ncbi:MAG: CRISPR-associated endonuclease Cas2 [Thermodesulfobacteriota bacterium]